MDRILHKFKIMLAAAFTATLILIVFATLSRNSTDNFVAYADEENLADIKIVSQPKSEISRIYGLNIDLTLGLSIDGVTCDYEWYRSKTENGTMMKIMESTSAIPQYSVTEVSETGYYYCIVKNVRLGGRTAKVNLVSERVYAEITPRPMDVIFSAERHVYNGKRQTLSASVNEAQVLEGDSVNVVCDYETATTNAGTYTVKLSLDNKNYRIRLENNNNLNENSETTFTIEKAPLEITIAEKAVVSGKEYKFEYEYKGFLEGESKDDLGFEPNVPERYKNLDRAGIYDITPVGPEESENYAIKYKPGKFYVNSPFLSGDEVESEYFVTAIGSFRTGTVMKFVDADSENYWKVLSFPKVISSAYSFYFTGGKPDGDTYTLKLNDMDLSEFMLSVCCVSDTGDAVRVNKFNYHDGTMTVTLPADYEGTIIVYYDYTIWIILAVIMIIVIICIIVVLFKSKQNYKLAKSIANAAKKEADKYRYIHCGRR